MMRQDINKLEEKSIFIIREANAKFKNLAALWSMGKDSFIILLSGFERSVTFSEYLSTKSQCDCSPSLLTPRTSAFSLCIPSSSLVKSFASIVQPGVSSFG